MKHSAEDIGQPFDHIAPTPEPPSWTLDRADADNEQLTRYLQIFCERKHLRSCPETEGIDTPGVKLLLHVYMRRPRDGQPGKRCRPVYMRRYITSQFPFFVRRALILLSRDQQCYPSMWELGSLRRTNSHVARSTELQTEQWEQIWQTRIFS